MNAAFRSWPAHRLLLFALGLLLTTPVQAIAGDVTASASLEGPVGGFNTIVFTNPSTSTAANLTLTLGANESQFTVLAQPEADSASASLSIAYSDSNANSFTFALSQTNGTSSGNPTATFVATIAPGGTYTVFSSESETATVTGTNSLAAASAARDILISTTTSSATVDYTITQSGNYSVSSTAPSPPTTGLAFVEIPNFEVATSNGTLTGSVPVVSPIMGTIDGGGSIDLFQTAVVVASVAIPEPRSFIMLAIGLAGLLTYRLTPARFRARP